MRACDSTMQHEGVVVAAAAAGRPSVRLRFFVNQPTGKCSFVLWSSAVTPQKLSLMSSISDDVLAIKVPTAGHEEPLVVSAGELSPELVAGWDPEHAYEVFADTRDTASLDTWVTVARVGELGPSQRFVRKPVHGRDILVLWAGGDARTAEAYRALDAVCYHFGGPLDLGDVEDVGQHQCVVCPWHRYRIDVSSGEALYRRPDGSLASKGRKQRTHGIRVTAGAEVQVQLCLDGDAMASDHYAMMGLWKQAASKQAPRQPPGQ